MPTMLTGHAYSSRDRVNVIIPGTGPTGEGNHHYHPARGRTAEWVRACITDAIEAQATIGKDHARKVAQCFMTPPREVTPGPDGRGLGTWARGPFTVTVRSNGPGIYAYTVTTADA